MKSREILLSDMNLGAWAFPLLKAEGFQSLDDILTAGPTKICRIKSFKVGCRRRLVKMIEKRCDELSLKDQKRASLFIEEMNDNIINYR